MATDATGTPTSLGIPKYNTSADAPSGLGFNAAMDAIDALIAARVTKPTGIVSGEAAVWNGTGWDRSSVTRLGTASLGSGTADSTKFLRGDGTWAVAGTPGYVTTLPASPVDGQESILVDSLTSPTYQWRFRYNASSLNTDKWEFVGGAPLLSVVAASEGTASSAFVDLTTVGPSLTVPRGGVYVVEWSFLASSNASGPANAQASIFKNLVDQSLIAYGGLLGVTAAGHVVSAYRRLPMTLAASDALRLRYAISNGISTLFAGRALSVIPIRVS